MTAEKTILYIEDDPVNRALVRKLMKLSSYAFLEAEDGLTGIAIAQEQHPDLILMDMAMPGLDGYETTTRIKSIESLRNIPIIALTAHAMKGDRERCLTAGCDGYISKPIDIDSFSNQVVAYLQGKQEKVEQQDEANYLREYNTKLVFRLEEQVKELRIANQKLSELNHTLEIRVDKKEQEVAFHTYHDELTGLPNRRLFLDRLSQAAASAPRGNRYLVVMVLDVDRFKLVNETLGHSAGDHVLYEIAKRLESCLRTSDTVARISADEFSLILTNLADPMDAPMVAKRIQELVAEPLEYKGKEVFVTASIGISLYDQECNSVPDLIEKANAALARCKPIGSNSMQFYSEDMNTSLHVRWEMENNLRKALERDEYILHFQPQVDLRSGKIMGAEALLRWQKPGAGLIPPGIFIPILEETGLINPVGEWILMTACMQNKKWQNQGLPPIRMSVNISAYQLKTQNIVDVVKNALLISELNPKYLELEITESILMEKSDRSIDMLTTLQALGVRISMDDFGTGYSSLAYLRKFPLNTLKIDRSFVMELPDHLQDAAIVSAIIEMGHCLDMELVAEGIETEAQRDFLREKNCDIMQGFLFSKPLAQDAFESLHKAES